MLRKLFTIEDISRAPLEKGDNFRLSQEQFESWLHFSTNNNIDLFKRNLIFSGFEYSQTEKGNDLSLVVNYEEFHVKWAVKIEWLKEAFHLDCELTDSINMEKFDEIPFHQVYEKILNKIYSRINFSTLESITRSNINSISDAVLLNLLKSFEKILSPIFYMEFIKYKSELTTQPILASNDRYLSFISTFDKHRYDDIWANFPMALRVLSTLIENFIFNFNLFLSRLSGDFPNLVREFSLQSLEISAIEVNLSDSHNMGQSVYKILFVDGKSLMYKPKDMGIEIAWLALIERLNSRMPPHVLKLPKIIERVGYGWVEFVSHYPCYNLEGVINWYQRCGAWLALFYVFGGKDIHEENLIASGEFPVPVDLEMTLQPPSIELDGLANNQAHRKALETIDTSVLGIGLIPTFFRSTQNELVESGGLSKPVGKGFKTVWVELSSDLIKPIRVFDDMESIATNLPYLKGRPALYKDFLSEFIEGFKSYCNFLRNFNDANFLFNGFDGVVVRKTFKSTRFYALILKKLYDARNMQDGIIWSSMAHIVDRFIDAEKNNLDQFNLASQECLALINLDIPFFQIKTTDRKIYSTSGVLVGRVGMDGYSYAKQRYESLMSADIKYQESIINSAFNFDNSSYTKPTSLETSFDAIPTESINKIILKSVDEIKKIILNSAIVRGEDVAWIGQDWIKDSGSHQLAPLGPDIFNGFMGVCIFLAACYQTNKDPKLKVMLLNSLRKLRIDLKNENKERFARFIGLGGCIGLGSVIYGLVLIGDLTDEPDLIDDASSAAKLITKKMISEDTSLDILGGSAGTIVALLKLFEATHENGLIKIAHNCAEHIYKFLSSQENSKIEMFGYAHGFPGIIYSLWRLSLFSADSIRIYIAVRGMWRKKLGGKISYFPIIDIGRKARLGNKFLGRVYHRFHWCRSTTGELMGIIGYLKSGKKLRFISIEKLRNLVNRATKYIELSPMNSLCCGKLGQIELLLEAGRYFDDEKMVRKSREQLYAILLQQNSENYRFDGYDGNFNLGIYKGLSGLGYSALRQINANLPNILLCE